MVFFEPYLKHITRATVAGKRDNNAVDSFLAARGQLRVRDELQKSQSGEECACQQDVHNTDHDDAATTNIPACARQRFVLSH